MAKAAVKAKVKENKAASSTAALAAAANMEAPMEQGATPTLLPGDAVHYHPPGQALVSPRTASPATVLYVANDSGRCDLSVTGPDGKTSVVHDVEPSLERKPGCWSPRTAK